MNSLSEEQKQALKDKYGLKLHISLIEKYKIKKAILLIMAFALIGIATYYIYLAGKFPRGIQLSNDVQIDSIVVYKSKRQMEVYSKGELLKTYKISLGSEPVGAKEFEGDKKTPEGLYFISDRNPNSRYHKNLGISYPNDDDIEYAKRFGKSAGSDIKIHGIGKYIPIIVHLADWTLGCIAVTDEEIDELYNTVKIGAKINIKP